MTSFQEFFEVYKLCNVFVSARMSKFLLLYLPSILIKTSSMD